MYNMAVDCTVHLPSIEDKKNIDYRINQVAYEVSFVINKSQLCTAGMMYSVLNTTWSNWRTRGL